MMFASTVFRRGNRCAQVYATDFGWARAVPMASRSEAHETLSLLFVRDGVPPTCICDNARELVQGKFHQKLKKALCHLKQLEPYTPWSNAAEREIKELKKGAGHKLLWSRAPKHLWDDCLELEAYIWSNTAHETYKLNREVPKTVMSGETSDISKFCELEWFEWVMFRDETAPFPDDMLKLGRYLGPSIDVGPAMTTKILTENGLVLHRSAYKPLTPDELPDKDGSDAQEQFMARVHKRLGSCVLPRELEDL